MYKKGVFVNVVEPDTRGWGKAFKRIENFLGRRHVELWVEHMPSREETKVLRGLLQGTDVILHGPFIHLSLASPYSGIAESSMARCSEAVELASALNAKVVTLHGGTYPVFESQDVALERLARRFEKFAALESPVVTLENMPIRGGTALECLGKLEDLRKAAVMMPDVRFTLDIGHCVQNGDDFVEFLRDKGDRIEDIHLHDGRLGGKGHLKLGAGELDLHELVRQLRELKYEGYIGLETITPEDTEVSWAVWERIEGMIPMEKS